MVKGLSAERCGAFSRPTATRSLRVRKAADPLPSTMLTGRYSSCCFARPIERVRPRNSHGASRSAALFGKACSGLEAKRLKDFHFTLEEGAKGSWPVLTRGVQIKK